MSNNNTYNISFTAGALMVNETSAVAEVLLDQGGDWDKARDIALQRNIMEKDKMATNKRVFALVRQRLETLTEYQLTLLVDGVASVKRLITYLAVCKAHAFIADFVMINVRDSFFNMNEKVSHANFNEFFNEKKYIHPELEAITEQTVAKVRQVVFRILEQSELIESVDSGLLQRLYLPEKVERAIVKDDPKWLATFLYSNNEISNAISLYE